MRSRSDDVSFRLLVFALAGVVAGAVHAADSKTPDGIWRSRGYGLLLDVHGQQITLYDVSSISCFKRGEPVQTSQFLIAPHVPGSGRLVAGSLSELTEFHYERIPRLPESCTAPARNVRDPLWNFDVFWQYFQDYYAFFDARAVDWQAIRTTYRPLVKPGMSDAQLFELFHQILRQLQDSHVNLFADGKLADSGISSVYREWFDAYISQSEPKESRATAFKKNMRESLSAAWKRYLDADSIRDVSPNLLVGSLAGGNVGYIMVAGEGGYAETENPVEELAAAKDAIAQAFSLVKGKRGLVLDLRFNLGGDDRVAIELAGWIAQTNSRGLGKCTRDGDGYTPLQQTQISRKPNAFTGTVIILTSLHNISAGENFLMMVKDFPHVLVLGETTATVHSDVLHKLLPNGWPVTISNEVFVAPDGTVYEAVGIDPDIRVPFFPEQVRSTGIDPGLEKALHLLHEAQVTRAVLSRFKRAGIRGRPSPCRIGPT